MVKKILCVLLMTMLSSCATNPNNQKIDTFVSLGDVYAKAGRLTEAEDYYQKAYDLDSEDTNISYRLADLQVQQGKFPAAIQTYQQILQVAPHQTKARYGLARATLSTGNLSAALSQYEILLNKNKGDHRALNGLGVILDNLSHYQLAKTCYKKGLVYAPQDFSLLNNLGVSYALSGNMTSAQHYLILSSQASPTSRSRDNLNLIKHEYESIPNPVEREKALASALLLNTKTSTPALESRAKVDAKRWCH